MLFDNKSFYSYVDSRRVISITLYRVFLFMLFVYFFSEIFYLSGFSVPQVFSNTENTIFSFSYVQLVVNNIGLALFLAMCSCYGFDFISFIVITLNILFAGFSISLTSHITKSTTLAVMLYTFIPHGVIEYGAYIFLYSLSSSLTTDAPNIIAADYNFRKLFMFIAFFYFSIPTLILTGLFECCLLPIIIDFWK